jgi:hypothetical protein
MNESTRSSEDYVQSTGLCALEIITEQPCSRVFSFICFVYVPDKPQCEFQVPVGLVNEAVNQINHLLASPILILHCLSTRSPPRVPSLVEVTN